MIDAISDIYKKVQPTLRTSLLAVFFTILFFISQPALAAVGPTGTYSDWNFPGSATTTDYKNFSWDVTVNVDPSPQSYFYSTQFWFIQDDKSIDPNGGYFGIQTNGSAPTGKIAIFSIWGAVDASGPEYAQPFGAEGTGYSVRITYPWVQGRTYHLRIGPIAADGQWWGAWIKDTVTGVENFVGQIKLSVPRLLLYNPPLSWTEYYGPPFSTCGEYSLSDVSFTNVAANDGTIKPNRYNNHLASPVNCPGSYIVNITDGTRQQMAASSDTLPPSMPSGLTATAISSSQINLSWSASTDNITVSGYKIYRNGSQISTTASTGYSDTGLSASTSYTYTVSAYDAASNQSTQSSSVFTTTQSPSASAPVISTFIASPSSITTGQSSNLSWYVIGSPAPSLSMNQNIGTVAGSSQSVSPTLTTTYTLTASNNIGSDSKSVTVSVATLSTNVPLPETLPPPPSTSTTTYSTRLINDGGTYYLVQNNERKGMTNPGMLYSYGFEFKDALPATAVDLTLPAGNLLLPGNGALVKSQEDPTIYLISQGQRHGFTSADVFLGLGFKWSSVLIVTNPELSAVPIGTILSNPSSSHWDGLDINVNGTIYWIDSQIRHPYPSLSVYNSWRKDNDFSNVVLANNADSALPVGDAVSERIIR